MSQYTTNQIRDQIFKSGYHIDMIQRPNRITGFLLCETRAFLIGSNLKNITEALNKMLDKIGELQVSGKYITKEMVEE